MLEKYKKAGNGDEEMQNCFFVTCVPLYFLLSVEFHCSFFYPFLVKKKNTKKHVKRINNINFCSIKYVYDIIALFVHQVWKKYLCHYMYLCSQSIVTRTFTLVWLVENWKVLIFSFKLFAEKIINFAMLGEQIVKFQWVVWKEFSFIFFKLYCDIIWFLLYLVEMNTVNIFWLRFAISFVTKNAKQNVLVNLLMLKKSIDYVPIIHQ